MNAAEKDFVQRGWDAMSNESIAKDVATKGKYINLAINYLAKRLDVPTIQEAKTFFRTEVNKYVERLLLNKLVFKAEHVLSNVNVNPKYYFFEFYANSEDSEVKCAIINYLKKTSGDNYDRDHRQMTIELNALKMVRSDERMRGKYPNVNTLEPFKELDAKVQKELLADVCFTYECELIVEELDKHVAWNYLLDHQLFVLLHAWIKFAGETLPEDLAVLQVTFENTLKKKFSTWHIDNEMIDQIKLPKYELPDYILDGLAKRSIFMKQEEDNINLLVKRITSSGSLIEHMEMLSSRPHSIEIVKSILDRKCVRFLIEDFVNVNDLIDVAPLYPDDRDEIELCIGLKQTPPTDISTISTKITEYLAKKGHDIQKDNSLVNLVNTLLQDDSSVETPSPSDFEDIPILAQIFEKFRSSSGQNDFDVTLQELVRRFTGVDLDSISSDAGGEGLKFSNELLFEKHCHGRTSKLNYIYYVKQCRSSYAVYTFLIEQLLAFSKITNQQIMSACTTVSELLINNFDNDELVTHCFSFMEMLDVNTMHLRAYVKCLRLVKGCSDTVSSEGDLLTTSLLERAILDKMQKNELRTRDLNAVRMVFELKKEKLPTSFLVNIAETKGWFQMIVFAMYFNYSLDQVTFVCDQVFHDSMLGMNLKRALRWENIPDKMKRSAKREKRKALNKNEVMVTSGETMSSSISSTETIEKHSSSKFLAEEMDLMAVIIQSVVDVDAVNSEVLSYEKFLELVKNPRQIQSTTHLNLLRNAIDLHRPVLSVLAAMCSQLNVQYCWAAFMMTAMESYQLPKESSDIQQLSRALIEFSIINGFSRTLHHGMAIFYADSNFNMFVEYLVKTKLLDFSTDTTDLLERYFQELSNNDVELLCLDNDNHEILHFSIKLLVYHLQSAFESKEYQRLMLESLCQSGIDFNNIIDFCFIKSINEILIFTDVEMDLSLFLKDQQHSDDDMKREYERICEQLAMNHEFSKAMTAADLFNLPKDNIIYESWLWSYETDATCDLDRYDREIDEYSLAPDIVISFYIHVASLLGYDSPRKYKILKKILDVIKRHHLFSNEGFDRDRIEYEMMLSFLRSPLTVDDIDLYYSEYFESIMSKERFVLYKSFLDLKEMAGIEHLAVGIKTPLKESDIQKLNSIINRLLDDGDIVQALRIQSMFNHRPLDLHYLVFCMALAEGLASLYDLSVEQRKMLSDGVKLASLKFNRRTLTSTRLTSSSSSPSSRTAVLDTSDSSAAHDFEEIPSREKQDVLEALQSLAAKINHGTKIGHRIAMTSQAAMYLDKEYVDVLKIKDPYLLLKSATEEDCLNKLVVMNDIMTSMEMTHKEIADFLAEKISISILESRFYLLQSPPPNKIPIGQCLLWGYDLDKEFRLFLELCPNTSMLGNAILQYCDALQLYRKIDLKELADTDIDQDIGFFEGLNSILEKMRKIIGRKGLSHKKQNTINVELLIKAHECFVHECYMEGIAIVLQRAKVLNNVLTNAKSWNLIVKMLTGIGRYRDMYYCFETLVKNEQFESLLGQFDDDKSNGLKQAIISYLNDHCPDATEYYRLSAVHFGIYKELSQMSENNAKAIVAKVIAMHEQKNDDANVRTQDEASITYLKCDPSVTASLTIAMDEYANAAENYLFDEKLNLAQRAAYSAELIALQIDLNNREVEKSNERCICVLNIRTDSVFRSIVNNNLSVPQSMILSHAYPYEINWTEAIFNQYILLSNEKFLVDYCDRYSMTDEMIESLVKSFQNQTNVTAKMERHISNLVEMVESVTIRYRLASLLGLKLFIAQMINGNSLFYLKDTNYGRNEHGN